MKLILGVQGVGVVEEIAIYHQRMVALSQALHEYFEHMLVNAYCSSSKLMILHLWEHLAMPGNIFGCHNLGEGCY